MYTSAMLVLQYTNGNTTYNRWILIIIQIQDVNIYCRASVFRVEGLSVNRTGLLLLHPTTTLHPPRWGSFLFPTASPSLSSLEYELKSYFLFLKKIIKHYALLKTIKAPPFPPSFTPQPAILVAERWKMLEIPPGMVFTLPKIRSH